MKVGSEKRPLPNLGIAQLNEPPRAGWGSAETDENTIVKVVHYFDYKSPYAYLAQAETFDLVARGAELEFVPYTLDIPSYLGSAKVDDRGDVVAEDRNPHQWRRVRYAYMDCRREANRRGLTIRGTRKIFDSSIAHIGFLFACYAGDPRAYHGAVFERFWRRELDIEDAGAIADVLAESGLDSRGFADYLASDGPRDHVRLREEAEARGVFGVPSYLVGGELYWGAERLGRVREHLLGDIRQ